jgi:3-oxoacyl-[acyl-carrier protein] reductase
VTSSDDIPAQKRVALVTGVGRRVGIGYAVVERLALDGYDVGFSYWPAYDNRMPWGWDESVSEVLTDRLGQIGARGECVPADLEDPASIPKLFDQIERSLGPLSALVMCHAESVDSGILDTSIESFDRHFAVNARATWLLIREFGRRYRGISGLGRIIALTSDALDNNVPYGSSKAALDRITLAAAREFGDLGVTANVINPGPTDTGWMTDDLKHRLVRETPGGRLGQPVDAANLVSFLCSPEGGWVNGQLLYSNGGLA